MSRPVTGPWVGLAVGLREDSDDCESRESDERIFPLAAGAELDLDRRHNRSSDQVGRPGLEPGTYGLKARYSGALSALPAQTGHRSARKAQNAQNAHGSRPTTSSTPTPGVSYGMGNRTFGP